MDTSVEKLEGNRVRLTVELDAAEVDEFISEAYGRMSAKVRIPGFRKGRAPRTVIDNYLGSGAVIADALEEAVARSYPRALDAENLRPTERPDTGDLDMLEPGKAYKFTAEFDVRPKLRLTSIEGLEISVPPSQTTDAEVDAQIDYLRDRFATLEVVEGRPVAEGDFALISFVGTIDGQPYEDNQVDKYLYELGRGGMPPAFDQGLIGASAGDQVHVEFEIQPTGENDAYAGKSAGFDITVHEVKAKSLPEVNDEFAANVGGFDTLDALKSDIRARLDENKATAHVRLVEREARDALAARLEGDIPDRMVGSKAESMMAEFFEMLQERGITMDQYVETTGVNADQIQADIALQARSVVADELALEALFEQAGLELTEQEIEDELTQISEIEKEDPAKLRERLVSTGVMPLVREQLIRRRAVRWLMQNTEIHEETPAEDAVETPGKTAGKKPRKARKAQDAPADEAQGPTGEDTAEDTSEKE